MSAGKNSKHIKNKFFLIADQVAKDEVEIRYMGTKSMWADVNTKPVQGLLSRTFRHHMMGVSVDYDDDVERKRTHPMLLPKIEPERITVSGEEMLKSIEVLTPTPTKEKLSPRIPKGILRGKDSKSTLLRSKLRRSEGVCWPESKYGSVSGPQWKWNSGASRFPHVAKALV